MGERGREQAWLQAGSQASSRAPQRETLGSSSHSDSWCRTHPWHQGTLWQPSAPELPGRGGGGAGLEGLARPRGAAQRLLGPPAPAGLPRVYTGLGLCIWKLGQHLCCRLPGGCASKRRRRAGGKCCHGVFRGLHPGLFIAPSTLSFRSK